MTSTAVAVVALVASSTADAWVPLAGRSVKIGCQVPLTERAPSGAKRQGLDEIAVEEINAKGGVGGLPIEPLLGDTQTLSGAQDHQPVGRAR